MPRKKKGQLKSGSIRIQVYVGKDDSGKRQYKSFTAATRQEAEDLARAWKMTADAQPVRKNDPTVSQALEQYIETCRCAGASPSTLCVYAVIRRKSFPLLENIRMSALTLTDIQRQINDRTATVSPKTLRNDIALLHAACKYERPDLIFTSLRIPKRQAKEMEIVEDAQLRTLLDALTSDHDMYLAVLLAAVMGLRRSEICGLEWNDIDFKAATMHIQRALVMAEDGSYVVKSPKTAAGDRVLAVPSSVLAELKARRTLTSRVVTLSPNVITERFEHAATRLGIPGRFHDLRHYHASTMIEVGAPEKYICADMGHASFEMVRRVYGHVKSSQQVIINAAMNDKASVLLQHDMQHDAEKIK